MSDATRFAPGVQAAEQRTKNLIAISPSIPLGLVLPLLGDDNKLAIVEEGSFHKFGQNAELLNYLTSTGDLVLVEASPVDRIWGIGLAADDADATNPPQWRGDNLLGFALMRVRQRLR